MMVRRLLSLLLVAALALSALAQTPAADPVQAELDALMALTRSRPPEGTAGADHYWWFDGLTRRIGTEAFAFIEKHPTDPRRWEAALILHMRRFHPRFVKSIGPDYATAGEAAVVRDTAAEAAWSAKVDELERQLRAATDVPASVREVVAFGDLMRDFQPAMRASFEKQPYDFAAADKLARAFYAAWPASESARGLFPLHVRMIQNATGRTELEILSEFAEGPSSTIRDYVQARQRFFALKDKPFELAFTALDGREVDLKKLRGKVVLIDFWATWCGPCIAEIPNVKKVFAAYHDKGFEIVGVSLDSERDRQKFIDLVAREGTTWPQRFTGQGWGDPLVKEYTISGIPAMFLLDQEGRLVSTDARGPRLEAEVRRLLKL